MIKRVRRYFHREKGSAALYFALVLTVLFGMASIAVDSSNAYLQRRVMQTAADSAALAGARALALQQDSATIDQEINTLAAANGSTTTSWELSQDGKGVDVTVSKDYDTYFARILGIDEMTANSGADASYAPVVGMDKLVPLAINGCDCLTFENFPQAIGQDDFGEIVIGNYIIGNARDVNIDYVLDLSGFDSAYSPTGANRPYYLFYDQGNNGVHTAFGDGTAHTVERVVNVNGDGFMVDLWFKERTSTAPGGSPHCQGPCPDTTDWYYYTDIEGTLTGLPGTRYEGAVIDVSERVRAAQVGTNAHLQEPTPYLGATAWLRLDVSEQPSTGVELQANNAHAVNSMILLIPEEGDQAAAPDATQELPMASKPDHRTIAAMPMPGAGVVALQNPSFGGLSLAAAAAPVATLVANTMQRASLANTSLSVSPLSGLTVSSLSTLPLVSPLSLNGAMTDELTVQFAAKAAAANTAANSIAAAAADYCPSNLLLNGSFEQVNGSGKPSNWSGNAGTGNHGYQIPDGVKYGYSWGRANRAMTQEVAAVPGGTYSMSFYSASHIPGSQTVSLQYLTAGGSPTGSAVVHTVTVDIDDPGHVFGGPYTLSLAAAPNDAAKVVVSISANNVDWAKVDMLCLTENAPEPTATNTPVPVATNTPVPPTATPTEDGEPTATPTPASCNLYPIALSTNTLSGALVGASLGDIWNGAQPGNFGWLTWVGAPNVPTLVTSLTPPGDSHTYVNPNDLSDRAISIGDWVQGSPGVSNASEVRNALDTLMTMDITVPVWDQATGTGNNSLYRVVNFARVRITSYQLPNQNRITATFWGYAPECGEITPTPTPTVPQPTPTPHAGSCSLDDAASNMNRYSLIVLDDLSTNSDVENRTFVGGNITNSSSANFGINVSGIAANEAMLVVVGDIAAGNPIQLNAGSLRLGGSSNSRVINYNGGGSLIPDNSLSDGPITSLLQDASAQLAAKEANNTADLPSGQSGPARFHVTAVNEDGAAIFEVAADELFGNSAVQQIDLNAGSASMVVINVTGSTVNWNYGNLVGNFNSPNARSRVIWNFSQASTINFNSYNMMGAVLAPYAHVTTAANIDGSVAVRALTTTSEIHQPTLTANLGALCDEDPNNPPTAEGRCQLVWLDWDGGIASNGELEDNILDPNHSGVRRVGETIAAGPEVENVRQITDALDQWLNKPMNIVLYDDGDQQNGYQVCGFAELTMTEYDFSSLPNWLAGEFNVSLHRGQIDENAPDYGIRDVQFK